jgi:hypothetical protein
VLEFFVSLSGLVEVMNQVSCPGRLKSFPQFFKISKTSLI